MCRRVESLSVGGLERVRVGGGSGFGVCGCAGWRIIFNRYWDGTLMECGGFWNVFSTQMALLRSAVEYGLFFSLHRFYSFGVIWNLYLEREGFCVLLTFNKCLKFFYWDQVIVFLSGYGRDARTSGVWRDARNCGECCGCRIPERCRLHT